LPYGVRIRIAGYLPPPDGTNTFEQRRMPSRIGTFTCKPPGAASEAPARQQRTKAENKRRRMRDGPCGGQHSIFLQRHVQSQAPPPQPCPGSGAPECERAPAGRLLALFRGRAKARSCSAPAVRFRPDPNPRASRNLRGIRIPPGCRSSARISRFPSGAPQCPNSLRPRDSGG